ncbi:MAG: MBL fold metallo-hydrolase [Planctomycetota bacterium]
MKAFLALLLAVCWSSSRAAAGEWQQPDPSGFPELFQWTDTCNVWLVRDGEACLLVDFGDGSLLPALPDIGVKTIERILLTHHHREQLQGLVWSQPPGATIAAPAAERELLQTPLAFRRWYPALGDKYSVYGASYARPPQRSIPIGQFLEDGQKISWRGYEIRCLAVPGHSPGELSYLLSGRDRVAVFSGGVMHDGSRMTTWFDSEWDYGFAKGLDVLMQSVERLRGEQPGVLYPSQGPVIRGAAEQLQAYSRRLAEFRAAYVRGYPVFDSKPEERDAISTPTPVPLISRVTPHLYKLSHQTQGRNFAIIVSDNGKGLVLDCGLLPAAQPEEIIVGMRAHLGLKEIDAFWISHMHGDHFLLGPMLKEKYGAKAWTLDMIADRCEHPRNYDYAALVSAYSDGFDGMQIDRRIRAGERIEWEGYTLQVDWMPGQTEFGCCLWLELDGRRIAFTGDNLFGNAQDPGQDGHEAVVARNSAIPEEGYLYAAEYLSKLQPDIIMGSHSYVMHEPAAFIERYRQWAQRIIRLYEELLPESDYEFLFDPYWVSAAPYRADLSSANAVEIEVTVRNFRSRPVKHRVLLQPAPGLTATPAVLEGKIPAQGRMRFPVTISIDRERSDLLPLELVPFDITLDGRRYGQWFDFVVRTAVKPDQEPGKQAP